MGIGCKAGLWVPAVRFTSAGVEPVFQLAAFIATGFVPAPIRARPGSGARPGCGNADPVL